MSELKFRQVLPEPAHPMVVRLHKGLVALYKHIREKYQVTIDQAFDNVSQQIGFVIATTVPIVLHMKDGRAEGGVVIDGKPFEGTLFDRELTKTLAVLKDDPVPIVPNGEYRLYLFWYEALKLKLRTDWMEPAHFRQNIITEFSASEMIWESMEPVHWFDPGLQIEVDDTMLISAIDEVYPELRLREQVGLIRQSARRPTAMQTAQQSLEPSHEILLELKDLLRRYGY